ncbi:helix-turn-helix domain-containing protein [Sphingomonas parva]|uniref:Helix-turn-helix domain-containing protein n=1 Tax=Sphingomonas parva TaxID=2555898 RepID=A0A4Y8ZT18_9SPHN|nr:helix-turn-helix domain-containing protein [Sphingomonas parva]TFI59064.1 helix-turn-helix domain-containing protein [Sphingomonas parva]
MTSPLLSPFATAFAARIPASVAALPFLFVRPEAADDEEWRVRTALATAAAAERADETRRNTRGRLAYLLCELGFQLGRRGSDRDAELPLPRQELARTLDVSLSKVKRILALLTLSQVIATDGAKMRILDWKRLCGVAQYDPARLEMTDDDEWPAEPVREETEAPRLTAAGDPACFV